MRLIRFLLALWNHVWHYYGHADLDTVLQRGQACLECPYRSNDICSVCGCIIPIKITWQDANCPLNYWEEKHV